MDVTDFELGIKLVPVEQKEQPALSEGYATLLKLGWPTCYISWKMCQRASANLVPRYKGIESWIGYKEAWAWDDIRPQ